MAGHSISTIALGLAALALAGCASPDPLEGQRTVFSNPHAAPDSTGIGPQCDAERGRDATCLGVPLTARGRGNTIGAAQTEGLSRHQRRILRERAELLNVLREQAALPPAPPPPPIADTATDAP